jgi:hypothetical protein
MPDGGSLSVFVFVSNTGVILFEPIGTAEPSITFASLTAKKYPSASASSLFTI